MCFKCDFCHYELNPLCGLIIQDTFDLSLVSSQLKLWIINNPLLITFYCQSEKYAHLRNDIQ